MNYSGVGEDLLSFFQILAKDAQDKKDEGNFHTFARRVGDTLGPKPGTVDFAPLPSAPRLGPSPSGSSPLAPPETPGLSIPGMAGPRMNDAADLAPSPSVSVTPGVPHGPLTEGDMLQAYILSSDNPSPKNSDYLKTLGDIFSKSTLDSRARDLADKSTARALQLAGIHSGDLRYSSDNTLQGREYATDAHGEAVDAHEQAATDRANLAARTHLKVAAMANAKADNASSIQTPEEADAQIGFLTEEKKRHDASEPSIDDFIKAGESPFDPQNAGKIHAFNASYNAWMKTSIAIDDANRKIGMRKIALLRQHPGDTPAPSAAPPYLRAPARGPVQEPPSTPAATTNPDGLHKASTDSEIAASLQKRGYLVTPQTILLARSRLR